MLFLYELLELLFALCLPVSGLSSLGALTYQGGYEYTSGFLGPSLALRI